MTRRAHPVALAVLTAGVVLSCNDTSVLKLEAEGDDPGECSDGADQDRDDLFDCDDPDCAGSDDCAEGDDTGGSGGGSGSGGTGDEDQPPSAPVVEVTPERPRDAELLTCAVVAASVDPDGDAVVYLTEWYVGGVAVGSGETLDPSRSTVDDTVECVVTPVAAGLSGPPGSDTVVVVPDCMTHVDADFSADWGPLGGQVGDASLVSGAARLFRTSTSWAMATARLSRDEPGALEVSARMVLREGTASFADEAQVVVCLTDDSGGGIEVPGVPDRLGDGVCIALSNETQNGSTAGAMLLENRPFDNGGSGRRLRSAFTPALDQWVQLEATRDLDHVWTFSVDGSEVGVWAETDLHTVRRVTVLGGQDTHAGYGGDLDDLYLEGCP